MQAACEDASSTTAGVVAEVQAAANLDFNFINDDLEEIRTNFFRSLEDDNNRSAANLSVVLDQLYLHDLPSNTTGYNLSCLQEIREDLQDTLQDMIVGIESCGNLSNAMEQIDSSIVRYEELKSNVTQISKNLTSLLATCSSQYPAQSWDLVTCVFQQVATTHSLLAPYWAEFQELNRAAGAELLLLHFDTFRCYQASLTLLGSVNQTVLQEVATCKT
ncbi:uncharacterized protein LOC124362480 isoform X1 [Homalodisca vitripennis]|uniref:uncharacterized protein LOC124362480 isoform X1 n=1 Tax=Homalodisca vitripennis TaxID=197043 RepID=UPI001EE9C5F5|nr:uncharacterized protein LOC124362480 isoform X1 [Homalodisca vitripennis]